MRQCPANMDNSKKGIALRENQGATVSFNSERYTQIQRFAMDLVTQQCVPFHVNFLSGQQTSRAALQEEIAGMGGGTSPTSFGALPVTVLVRLRDRKGSSRLLIAVSHIHSTQRLP